MIALLGARASDPASSVPEVLTQAARETLTHLLDEQRFSREGALDLLVADAFMTYAFEHAAGTRSAALLDVLALDAASSVGELAKTHV